MTFHSDMSTSPWRLPDGRFRPLTFGAAALSAFLFGLLVILISVVADMNDLSTAAMRLWAERLSHLAMSVAAPVFAFVMLARMLTARKTRRPVFKTGLFLLVLPVVIALFFVWWIFCELIVRLFFWR